MVRGHMFAVEFQAGEGVFGARSQGAAGGGRAVACVDAGVDGAGVSTEVVIRTVVKRDRDARRRAALYHFQIFGVGLAFGVEPLAVRAYLAVKVQSPAQS